MAAKALSSLDKCGEETYLQTSQYLSSILRLENTLDSTISLVKEDKLVLNSAKDLHSTADEMEDLIDRIFPQYGIGVSSKQYRELVEISLAMQKMLLWQERVIAISAQRKEDGFFMLFAEAFPYSEIRAVLSVCT